MILLARYHPNTKRSSLRLPRKSRVLLCVSCDNAVSTQQQHLASLKLLGYHACWIFAFKGSCPPGSSGMQKNDVFDGSLLILLWKVVIKYESLVNGEDLSESIEAAYGFDGYATITIKHVHIYKNACRLGLLTVSGVPGVSDIRQRFLPFGKKYVHVTWSLYSWD